jgi:hypothetical protein
VCQHPRQFLFAKLIPDSLIDADPFLEFRGDLYAGMPRRFL